jgi:hypothetical protein
MYDNGSYEVFIVGNCGGTQNYIISESTGDANPIVSIMVIYAKLRAFYRGGNNSILIDYESNLGSNETAGDNNTHIWSWRDTGKTMQARVDGGDTGTPFPYSRPPSFSSNPLSRSCLGGLLRDTFIGGWTGSIKEIIICNLLTDQRRRELENYLYNKHINPPAF